MFRLLMPALALCVLLAGCGESPSQELSVPGKVAVSGEMEARLSRIEQDLLSLRIENDRRLEALKGDIESLRGQMEQLAEALAGRAQKDELDESAREFARESMQRMLDLSKKIMDKLEKELESTPEGDPGEPEGQTPENDKTI
ncbi:hypothetical protein [Salidesulfovibrio onnuriiensis]|uniref:hypothetical protein n=1 Tax=Salidesulfovibrio onnuriiensis TaxID=2583823 RepID=UPI0011CC73D4|nr:hypothetical protein [Salidesulfovibrio onnuriiensis]